MLLDDPWPVAGHLLAVASLCAAAGMASTADRLIAMAADLLSERGLDGPPASRHQEA